MNINIRMKRVMSNHTESVSSTSTEIIEKKSKKLSEEYDLKKHYLHVAPCGDFWIGSSIFAAKHLQPDYVKSIPIPCGKNGTYFDVEQYLDDIEDDETKTQLLQEIYDTNRFPTSFLKLME